jgi:hypothetical protein
MTLLPCSKRRPSLNHLVDETAEAEVVWAVGVLLVVNDLRRHVSYRAHAPPHHLTVGDLEREAKVRDAHVALVVEQDVLGLAVTVHDAVRVKVVEAEKDLGGVKLGSETDIKVIMVAFVLSFILLVKALKEGRRHPMFAN